VTIRYIVNDVQEVLDFYVHNLGFEVIMHPAPGFASLRRGDLNLLVNSPDAGGAGQALPDGTLPEPGGWNRLQLEVEDLATLVERLKGHGATFRNEIVSGNGGMQILLEDPSGNPIELFQAHK
jgi:catechol 2,3-dioxygenase-like lactoylglutathione lyase family enzyme